MRFQKRLLFLLIILFSISIIISASDIKFPLKVDCLSSIPLESEDTSYKTIIEKEKILLELKSGNVHKYWSFTLNDLRIKRIVNIPFKKFDNIKPREKSQKNYKLLHKDREITFLLDNKKKWKRDAPEIKILDYSFDGKTLLVLFRNGFLNVFSKDGDLIFWKNLDYKSEYIVSVQKGFFIFSSDSYYYYNSKQRSIKSRKLNITLSEKPVVKDNHIYLWGLKHKANFFAVEKLSGKVGVFVKINKTDFFTGENAGLNLINFNIEKLKTSLKVYSQGNIIQEEKNSKDRKFSVFLPHEGIVRVELTFSGENYNKTKEFTLDVYDRNKIIREIIYYLDTVNNKLIN